MASPKLEFHWVIEEMEFFFLHEVEKPVLFKILDITIWLHVIDQL